MSSGLSLAVTCTGGARSGASPAGRGGASGGAASTTSVSANIAFLLLLGVRLECGFQIENYRRGVPVRNGQAFTGAVEGEVVTANRQLDPAKFLARLCFPNADRVLPVLARHHFRELLAVR